MIAHDSTSEQLGTHKAELTTKLGLCLLGAAGFVIYLVVCQWLFGVDMSSELPERPPAQGMPP